MQGGLVWYQKAEGDAFLCILKYISSKCFQSVVCIEHLHLLLKANFCEKEMYSCV